MEFLDLARPGPRAATVEDFAVVVEGRADMVQNLRPGDLDAERLGGLDDGDAGLGVAGDGAEPTRSGGQDAGRGSEAIRQDSGSRTGIRCGAASGEQQFEQIAVVGGFPAGPQETGAQPMVAWASPTDAGASNSGMSRKTASIESNGVMPQTPCRKHSGALRHGRGRSSPADRS